MQNDFNCPKQCGLYDRKDKVCCLRKGAIFNYLFQIGPRLHKQCKAYNKKKCKGSVNVNRMSYASEVKKKKTKAKKDAENRIVGGKPALDPMPWMVMIWVKGANFGVGSTNRSGTRVSSFVPKPDKDKVYHKISLFIIMIINYL